MVAASTLRSVHFCQPIGDDEVVVSASPAGKVEDEALFADRLDEGGEALLVEVAVAEDVGGNDDVAGAGVEERRGGLGGDAAAHLQTAGEGGDGVGGRPGGGLVAGEHDDVAAVDTVALVHARELRGGGLRLEVGLGGLARGVAVVRVLERPAHDLLHATLMDVDARTEPHRAGKVRSPAAETTTDARSRDRRRVADAATRARKARRR